MLKVDLKWNVIPACMYGCLESHYNPMFGKGVYLLIHDNGKRYQIYYIGRSSDGDIGNRLACHYQKYAGTAFSTYWLPKEAALFNGDIYKLFNDEQAKGKYFMQEGPDFSNEERRKVGGEIMKNTYFAFARVTDDLTENIKDIEACLQCALQKKNNLRKPEKYGWFGENAFVKPAIDLEITNIYASDKMKEMISTTLPDIIRCDKQCSTEIFSREPD